MKLGPIILGIALAAAVARGQPAVLIPPSPPRVLLQAFEQVGGDTSHAFIGVAIQQNLLAELRRAALAPTTQPASNPQYVISGSYQIAGGDIRISGDVLAVDGQRTIAVLKATGPLRELFALEDVIAEQARRALPARPGSAVASTQPTPAPAPVVQSSGPVRVPAVTYEGSALQQAALGYPPQSSSDTVNAYNRYYLNPPGYYNGGYISYYPYVYYPGYLVFNWGAWSADGAWRIAQVQRYSRELPAAGPATMPNH